MSINRYNAKRDKNEPEIVKALQAVGALVVRVSGRGVPDTLVIFREQAFLLEIKGEKGTLTEPQVEFFKLVGRVANIGVVRSIDEALAFIGAT